MLRALALFILAGVTTFSADPPILPLTVCEVLRDLPAQEGKSVAVIGRYSFRETGRWVGEQVCDPPVTVPPQLWLLEDTKDGPKPPGNYALDGAVLGRKFNDLRRHTELGKFRFGTSDYDRWVVIYGRVESRKPGDAGKAAANLVFRGSGVIVFLTPE